MGEGRSNSGTAAVLVVSERAVEKHVTGIFVLTSRNLIA